MHPSSYWELDIYNASAEQLREHLGNRPPPPPLILQNGSGNIVLLRSLITL